jgi:hypothetical protein
VRLWRGTRGVAYWCARKEAFDEDEDESEDEEPLNDEELDDEMDEEDELDTDDTPATAYAVPDPASTWDTIEQLGGLLGFLKTAPRTTNIRTRQRAQTPSTVGADPRTRLGAITAELDAKRPSGRAAVALLIEASGYLRPGTLAQYAEARACRPEDIAAAERAVPRRATR